MADIKDFLNEYGRVIRWHFEPCCTSLRHVLPVKVVFPKKNGVEVRDFSLDATASCAVGSPSLVPTLRVGMPSSTLRVLA